MGKLSSVTFSCQGCGTPYPKWQGQCSTCQSWNTIVEEEITSQKHPSIRTSQTRKSAHVPQQLGHIPSKEQPRIPCPDQEFNRVLGGGVVLGSLVLMGGEPGIGKSTLLLQVAASLTSTKVFYVSGEESLAQIKLRAERLGLDTTHCYFLHETSLENILDQAEKLRPGLLIIDSIQTLQMDSTAPSGSITQVRDCANMLFHYAKHTQVPVFLIGHINKEGFLAGPKVLEHMVDTVLQFEGDRNLTYRIVRAIKNRFGATSELGIYTMQDNGLRAVSNPSALLLAQQEQPLNGVAVGVSLEGNRPMLIEVQALVSTATYGTPQRVATGFNAKRLSILLAILEKRSGLRLGTKDVFLHIAGGLQVNDPALDLAVCVALASSLQDHPVPRGYCFAAEVGLGGEIRGVNRIEQRVAEAAKLGLKKIYIAYNQYKDLTDKGRRIAVQAMDSMEKISSFFVT